MASAASAFVPSTHGLRFTNSWPDQPLVVVGGVGIGNARRGLCGGMVFTALDVFVAGLPPLEQARPSPGSPLYRYLVKRLFDSFDIPTGVLSFYQSMLRPDRDVGRRRALIAGLARRTIVEAWPSVKADLDAGRPSPLGLVTVRSANPVALGQNHQVLAYGYHQRPGRLTIKVYDPNSDMASADDIWISLDIGMGIQMPITHNVDIGRPLRGFFRVRYRPADPSALAPVRRV